MFRDELAVTFQPYAELSETQLQQLEQHYNLLESWNRKLNLIRFKNLKELIELHYAESLFLGLHLPEGPIRVVDVGSGGGFPGIPVAVLRPSAKVRLLERDQRKSVFLREATRHLTNVQVLTADAASCPRDFDWVISRAVSPGEVLKFGLTRNIALLVSDKDAPTTAEVFRVPWGEHRVIARVPRETC
jgi:16S rRNA (guanine(527)-N(7))-methyltransferase RsmG